MNKTMPPELLGDKKEDIPLESNRPFQEDKKDKINDNKIVTLQLIKINFQELIKI